MHLKFYTASEIHHMSKLEGCTHEQVLHVLQDAGLDSMPGGGAEVFADRVRAPRRAGQGASRRVVRRPRHAHRLGIPTQCTMLYGHVETYEERIDHLIRLREQQDKTAGFMSFIPLAFHPENTVFERRGWKFTDRLRGSEGDRGRTADARQHSAREGLLDHDGPPMAQLALHFGANDVQGTVVREKIFQAAGAVSGTEQKIDELVRFVRDAGRIPVQRDSLYNELHRW